MPRNLKSRKTKSGSVKITEEDIAFAREHGKEALEYYQRVGLAETRRRATDIAFSGGVSLFGLIFLGWSPLAMLAFVVINAVITVASDLIRFLLALHWVEASHKSGHKAGQVLLIVGGLEDGTGTRPDNKEPPNPRTILFFGVVSTLFLLPILAAATEKSGSSALLDVAREQWFLWFVGVDVLWRIVSAVKGVAVVRRSNPGEKLIFFESGGVAVLYGGLLILIWLAILWGQSGLLAMFVIILLFQMSFGIFTCIWMPRAVATLKKRVEKGDFSLRVPSESPARL